jgi:activating signal cointegrator 1
MRALTIIQPFAELIALQAKRCENRTWATNYRGLLAIHAGKSRRYQGEDVREIAENYLLSGEMLAFGAIIAVARLVDCVQVSSGKERAASIERLGERFAWMHDHEHAEGPWCFVLRDVRRVGPIECNGAQGLWMPPPDIVAELQA